MSPLILPYRLTAILAFAVYLAGVGEFMLAPILTPLARAFGCSLTQASWLISSHAIAYAVAAPAAAMLGRRVSKKSAICMGLLLFALDAAALVLLAPVFPHAFAAALVLRVIGGIAAAIVIPAVFSLIADLSSPEEQTHAMGLVMVGMTIGIATGPAFAGLLAQAIDWRASFIGLGILGLVVFGAARHSIPEQPSTAPQRTRMAGPRGMPGGMADGMSRLGRAMRPVPLYQLVAKAIWLSVAVASYLLSGEVLRAHHELSTAEIGLATSLFGLGLGGGNLAAGRVERRLGKPELTLLASLAAVAAAQATLFLPGTQLAYALAALCLLGIGLGVAAPVSTAILATRAGPSNATVLAFSESLNNIALMMILPLGASHLASETPSLMLASSSAIAVSAVILLIDYRRLKG